MITALRPFVFMSLALLVSASCAATTSEPVTGRTIEILMSDFAFAPARILLRPGERVTLKFKNDGSVEHEFMAGTGSMPGNGYMQDWLGHAKLDPVEADHADGHTGASIRVPARGSATIAIVVPPQVGELEFGCFIADHYQRGMHGAIVVDQGRAPNAVPTVPGLSPSSGPTATPMPHPSGGMDDEVH